MADDVKTWPPDLRRRLTVPSFNQTTKVAAIRSNMDVGVDKVRNRYTTPIYHISGNMICSKDQLEILDSFFNIDLNNGVLKFYFPDPITEEIKEHRFLEPPKYSALGGDWFSAALKMERF